MFQGCGDALQNAAKRTTRTSCQWSAVSSGPDPQLCIVRDSLQSPEFCLEAFSYHLFDLVEKGRFLGASNLVEQQAEWWQW